MQYDHLSALLDSLPKSWTFQAPLELLLPHLHITTAYIIPSSISRYIIEKHDIVKRGEVETAIDYLVNRICELRDEVFQARASFTKVEWEFGAVDQRVIKFKGLYFTSRHHAMIHRIAGMLDHVISSTGFSESDDSDPEDFVYRNEDFSKEELQEYFRYNRYGIGGILNDLHRACSSCKRDRSILRRLQKELFRVWKAKYPDPKTEYQTVVSGGPLAEQAMHLISCTNTPIHTRIQRAILEALEGQAMTLDELQGATKFSRSAIMNKNHGMEPLRNSGMVINDRKIGGYYRPDSPPSVKENQN